MWSLFGTHPLLSPVIAALFGFDLSRLLIAVVVVVAIVVAVFPIAVVMGVFVPFSFFATIPLTIGPSITVTLIPFAVVPTRYDDGKLLC
jgi:hypothetical protein